MSKIKTHQDGFGAVEGLLVIIAITLIVGVGFFVFNSQKSDKKDVNNQTVGSSQAHAKSSEQSQSTLQPKSIDQPKQSDIELITQAVKSYKGADGKQDQSHVTVTVDNITGDDAKGSFFEQGVGGASFTAHRSNNSWQVVSESQQ